MTNTTQLIVPGLVTGPSKTPLGSVIVSVHINKEPKPRARAVTDKLGQFEAIIESGRTLEIHKIKTIGFTLRASRDGDPFFETKHFPFAEIGTGRIKIQVPEAEMEKYNAKPVVSFLVDNAPSDTIGIGQSGVLAASRLRPATQFVLQMAIDGSKPLVQTIVSDSFGTIESSTVLPQFGLWEFDSDETRTIEEGLKRWGGKTLAWELLYKKKAVAKGQLAINKEIKNPMAFVSDKQGRLRN